MLLEEASGREVDLGLVDRFKAAVTAGAAHAMYMCPSLVCVGVCGSVDDPLPSTALELGNLKRLAVCGLASDMRAPLGLFVLLLHYTNIAAHHQPTIKMAMDDHHVPAASTRHYFAFASDVSAAFPNCQDFYS